MKKVLILIAVLALVSLGSGYAYMTTSLSASGTLALTQSNWVPTGSETITLVNPNGSSTFNTSIANYINGGMYKNENVNLTAANSGVWLTKTETNTWGSPNPISPANVFIDKWTITANGTQHYVLGSPPTFQPVTNLPIGTSSTKGSGSASLYTLSNSYIVENGTVSTWP